jgi:transcriptional regulator with XRE-family HTH domain
MSAVRHISRRVGANLKLHRTHLGMRQEDVGRRMSALHPTWKRATISEIERGQRAVTVDELVDLAVILNVPVTALLAQDPFAT